MRPLAARYGVTESAVRRHAASHLPRALVKAQEISEVASGRDLLAEVAKLQDIAEGLLSRAYQGGNLNTALNGVREARACLELQGRMLAAALQLAREGQGPERTGGLSDEELLQEAIDALESLGYVVVAPC